MPYALNDTISQSEIEGGIEITDAEYAEAFNAKLNGQETDVVDGELIIYSATKRTVYSTEDGQKLEIPENKETPEGYTDTERPTPAHEWNEGWELNEAKAWEHVRHKRDMLLKQSDWTQLDDSPLKGNQAWLDYRQALRDITIEDSPEEVTWPTQP